MHIKDQQECTLKEKLHVEFDLLCHTSIDVPALITPQAHQYHGSNMSFHGFSLSVLTSVSVGLRSLGLLFKSILAHNFSSLCLPSVKDCRTSC